MIKLQKLHTDTREFLEVSGYGCFVVECHDCPCDKNECIEEILTILANINKDIVAALVAELKNRGNK